MSTPNNIAKASMMIRKPIAEVFEAFINPDVTTKFWFTKSSGKLQEGKEVAWVWEMYNLTVPVKVDTIEPDCKILIEWGEGKDQSKVEWNFKPLTASKTYVEITNFDIQGTGDELANKVADSTGGFTMVVAGLKAWLEHGVELNLVGDKFPVELM